MKTALLLIGFGFGLLWGWAAAHYTASAECDRTKELEQ